MRLLSPTTKTPHPSYGANEECGMHSFEMLLLIHAIRRQQHMKEIFIMQKQYNTQDRVDIVEQNILDAYFDIENIDYMDAIKMLSKFFDEIIVAEKVLDKIDIKDSIREKVNLYLNIIRRYVAGDHVESDMCKFRVDAWAEYDKEDGIEKSMLRIVVMGLYSEEALLVQNEWYSDEFLGIVFYELMKIGYGLCKRFREFLMNDLIMKKYILQPCSRPLDTNK